MNLRRALRLSMHPCLALVGAGGKTTALGRLAGELRQAGAQTVLITTTTHLGAWQLSGIDARLSLNSLQDLETLLRLAPAGLVFLAGSEQQDGRLSGPPADLLEALAEWAQQNQQPLLIEADGSRLRPLKAPAEHEPAIPPFAREVTVVAGLSGLGRPLEAASVHRPERFAALSGLSLGKPVTPQALVNVLTHPLGGLKNIPPGAQRRVLLTQADSAETQALAQGIAEQLLGVFQAAVIAGQEKIQAVFEPVAGVILAAGGSQRFGQPKQLLLWQGEPLVRRAVLLAQRAGLSPVIVVVGSSAEQVEQALAGLPVKVVPNPAWQSGQSASVRAGVAALPPESGAAVFLLADQPRVTPDLVQALVAVHRRTLAPIVAPQIDGRRGNPVLFDRDLFPALAALRGDQGGRALFSRSPVEWLPWHDSGPLLDIDTPEDYRRLQEV